MSDFGPDAGPDVGPDLASPLPTVSGGSSPGTALHPRMTVTYDGDILVLVGTNGPIRFLFSHADGTLVTTASAAQVTITNPDGTATKIMPDAESTSSAATQVLSCDYPFTTRGLYTIKILATFGTEIAGAFVSVIADN